LLYDLENLKALIPHQNELEVSSVLSAKNNIGVVNEVIDQQPSAFKRRKYNSKLLPPSKSSNFIPRIINNDGSRQKVFLKLQNDMTANTMD